MVNLFESSSYKDVVRKWVLSRPKKGHGQYRKIAEKLRVTPVLVSQVFNGSKDLSGEQALDLSRFMGLTELETEYFHLLVQRERAGTDELKRFLDRQLQRVRSQSKDLKKRVKIDAELTEEAKAIFYSSWIYSAIRLLSAIPGFNEVDTISERLGLEREQTARVLEFLTAQRLVIRDKAGKYQMGPQVTHLEAGSPLIRSRQIQWRLLAIERMAKPAPEHFFYTGPMVLSKNVAQRIHQSLLKLIQDATREVAQSDPEELACLNVDWFRI